MHQQGKMASDQIVTIAVASWITIVLLVCPSWAQSQLSAAALWKARALEAADKISVLRAKLDKIPEGQWNSKEARRLKCEAMVEYAYAMHLTEEAIVHKREGDSEVFHIILNGGEAGLFDLVYVYSVKDGLLVSRVDLLPKNWHLIFIIPGQVQLLMPHDGCLFHFDFKNPFAGKILD